MEAVEQPRDDVQLTGSRPTGTTTLAKAGWNSPWAAPVSAMTPTIPPASPRVLFCALRRRWPLALGGGLFLGLATACAAWFLIPAPYTAETELKISSVQEKIMFTTIEERASFTTYKQSQMRMIKSPLVLGAALREPDIANLALVREHVHPITWLQEKLATTSPAMEFLQIALSGENPRELAQLVNAVTNAYLEEVVNDEQNKRREKQASLEKIHRELNERIRSKENQLKKLAESLSTGDSKTLSMKEQFAAEYHARLRNELAQITFDLTRTRIALAGKKAGSQAIHEKEISDSVVDNHLSQDGEIQRLKARVAQLGELLTKYDGTAPTHANVAAYRKEMARLEDQLQEARDKQRPTVVQRVRDEMAERIGASETELEEKVALLTSTADELQRQLDSQQSEQKKTGTMAFDLAALSKEISQFESLAKTISDEMKRLEIELTAPPRVTVLQSAQVPHLRNMKPKYAGTAFAGLGLFGLVVFGVVWTDFKAHRVNSIDEVAEHLGMRVMGSIPLVPRLSSRAIGTGRHAARMEFWQTALSESIDSIRTILLRDSSIEAINVVMVSSAAQGEGKTTLSLHLGHSLARAGRQTLLVDTDMRRPSMHAVFDQPLAPGFCELLRGEASLAEAIRPTSAPGLFILPAGQLDEACLRALAQNAAAGVFEQLRKQFAFVIVDSSPLLPVADGLLVAQHVDAVVFSVRRDVSRCAKVTAACQRLAMLDVPFLGIVAIGLDEGAFRYPNRSPYGSPLRRANPVPADAAVAS